MSVAHRPSPSFLIFQDDRGLWRWNFADAAGRIVAASTMAFTRPNGCFHAVRELRGAQPLPLLVRRPHGKVDGAVEDHDLETIPRRRPEARDGTLDLKLDQILH
jgi:hypothetical protein